MRKHLFFAAAMAALLAAGTPALSQMAGGVRGGTGGGPQDARNTDRVFDELKAEKKISTPVRAEAPDELVIGADLVKQGKFAEAIPHLELALTRKPNNSTTLIYLGFSHRMIGAEFAGDARTGEYEKALGYYRQAMAIDPDNKLLHEYLGKLHLLMRDQTSAQSELNALEKLCPSGCDERDALSNVLLAYMAKATMDRASPPAASPPAR